jgi:hypothetical protein
VGFSDGKEAFTEEQIAFALRHAETGNGVKLDFSRPGNPTDNAVIESFHGRLCDECLHQHSFLSLDEARAVTEAWREDYDRVRPHGALGKPVTGGNIVFSPAGGNGSTAPGKPGAAEIRPDGSFVLTLAPGGKGLAERFTVRFTPPVLPPMSEAEAKVTLPPYQGFVPKQPDVAVRSGANTLDIELVKAVKR